MASSRSSITTHPANAGLWGGEGEGREGMLSQRRRRKNCFLVDFDAGWALKKERKRGGRRDDVSVLMLIAHHDPRGYFRSWIYGYLDQEGKKKKKGKGKKDGAPVCQAMADPAREPLDTPAPSAGDGAKEGKGRGKKREKRTEAMSSASSCSFRCCGLPPYSPDQLMTCSSFEGGGEKKRKEKEKDCGAATPATTVCPPHRGTHACSQCRRRRERPASHALLEGRTPWGGATGGRVELDSPPLLEQVQRVCSQREQIEFSTTREEGEGGGRKRGSQVVERLVHVQQPARVAACASSSTATKKKKKEGGEGKGESARHLLSSVRPRFI